MRSFCFALLAILSLIACNDDFEIVAPAKDIPVVYALFDLADTAFYVRVERVYVSDNQNATDLALIPDSIYYPADAISVELTNVATGNSVNMVRVDGNLEGYPRETGSHTNAPNWLYKIKKSQIGELNFDNELKVVVRKGEKELTEAITKIVGPYAVNYAVIPDKLIFTNPKFTFSFRSDEKSARIYDITLRFTYEENSPEDLTAYQTRFVDLKLEENKERDFNNGVPVPIINVENFSTQFYQFVSNNLSPAIGFNRKFVSVQYIVDAGGEELFEYRNRLQANSGITGTQALPLYTNLSFGYGLTSSKSRLISPTFNITTGSLDSLKTGFYTKNLGF